MSFRKKMAFIACAGIFIMGIGTGISFLEYSEFTYGGKQELYENSMAKDTFILDFDGMVTDNEGKINDYFSYHQPEVVSDSSVSENQIVFEINYNKAFGTPSVVKEDRGNIFNITKDYEDAKSDLEIFMDCKNRILRDIKSGVITEYTSDTELKCNIKVAPGNVARVREYLR